MFSNCDSKILDSFVGGVRLWKILCLSVNLCLAYQNNLLQAGRQAGKQAGKQAPTTTTSIQISFRNCHVSRLMELHVYGPYTTATKKKLLFWDTFRSYEQWWWTCLCVLCVFVCCVCCVRKFLVCRSLSLSLSFCRGGTPPPNTNSFFFFSSDFWNYRDIVLRSQHKKTRNYHLYTTRTSRA